MEQFPVPLATSKEQEYLIDLVEKLIELNKDSKRDYSSNLILSLEKEVDEFVMDLFDLDEHEKNLVRDFEMGN